MYEALCEKWGQMATKRDRSKAWETVRLEVLNRDDWQCVWCQKALVGSDATADHYPIPKSKGGPDEAWNLVAACRSCNGFRQDRALNRVAGSRAEWFVRPVDGEAA